MKEFDFLKKIKPVRYHLKDRELGIGDDAALIGDFLIAKDIIVSDIHFKKSAGVENILFKLITSNVSDIAAMGGKAPFYGLLGISAHDEFLDENFLKGLRYALDFYNVDLIGGDTTSSKHDFFLSFTIIAKKNRYVLKRNGAKAGDYLFVSRGLGYSKISLEKELGLKEHDIDPLYHYRQVAEVELGRLLGTLPYVTSCIDISDGLGRDLGHIAEKSGVRIVLDEEKLPLKHLEKFNLSTPVDYFVSSGEEYALAFTVGREYLTDFMKRIKRFDSVYLIGEVVDGTGVFLKRGSDFVDISRKGFEHEL
ncbi:MAG: thiamine-phosphate kinase [Calditerrivibrio sp.]|nr:thiamine-phosphate kinase [Calditerrivibrio sp.]